MTLVAVPVTGASYCEVVESHAVYFCLINAPPHVFIQTEEGMAHLKQHMLG